MPGFGLAKKAIEVFERDRPSDGLILGKHGIVTFGDNAREAYERMIEMVSLAEDFIARNAQVRRYRRAPPATSRRSRPSRRSCAAPAACMTNTSKAPWQRLVLEFRTGDAILDFCEAPILRASARRA